MVNYLRRKGRGAARLLLICALAGAFAAGCGTGDSDSGTSVAETVERQTTSTIPQQTTTPRRTSGPTRAILRPVDDSTASGVISFAKKADGTPLMKFRLEGLQSSSDGTRYVFWQLGSRHDMVVVAGFLPRSDGRIVRKSEAATEPFYFIEAGTKTEFLVTEMSNDQWQGVFSGEDPWDPPVIGRPLLRGAVTGSLVGAAADD